MTTATPARLLVRPITAEDNPAIAHVIREVSAEHGLTADKGYTVSDPNLDALYQLYSLPRSAYWVIEVDGRRRRRRHRAAAGRRRRYLRIAEDVFPAGVARQGIGETPGAAGAGFRPPARLPLLLPRDHRQPDAGRCAVRTPGFEHIDHAMGATGHVDCEVTMLKTL